MIADDIRIYQNFSRGVDHQRAGGTGKPQLVIEMWNTQPQDGPMLLGTLIVSEKWLEYSRKGEIMDYLAYHFQSYIRFTVQGEPLDGAASNG